LNPAVKKAFFGLSFFGEFLGKLDTPSRRLLELKAFG